MKQWFAFGTAVFLLAALPYATFAKGSSAPSPGASVQKEVATAQAHALMAAHATSITMTHAHLHHVINCLVGPKGNGFDASAEDPCKGMGNGAIPDAGSNSKLAGMLESAVMTAQVGIKSDKLSTAQQAAQKTAAILQTARGSDK